MKSRIAAAAASVITLLMLALPAQASVVEGQLLGVFAGNDSVASLFDELGLTVTNLAKIEMPSSIETSSLSNEGLTITDFVLNDDNEALSGQWSYAGPEIANIIVLKADGYYAVYAFTNAITDNMPNIGLFSVADITDVAGEHGLSHIAAYNAAVVPVPAAVWLFASGLLGLGIIRRKTD